MKSAELVDTTGFAGFSPNLTQSSMRRTIPVAFIFIFILLSVLCLTGFIIRKSAILMQKGEFWKNDEHAFRNRERVGYSLSFGVT